MPEWKLENINGHYYARKQTWTTDETGKKKRTNKRISLKTTDRDEGLRLFYHMIDKPNKNKPMLTFGEVLELYVGYANLRQRSWDSSSRYYLKYFQSLKLYSISELRFYLETWQDNLLRQGLSTATIQRISNIISSCLSWGVRNGHIEPSDRPIMPRMRITEPITPYLTPDEIKSILGHSKAIGDATALFVRLGLHGLRLREILSLRHIDIDKTSQTILIRKHENDGFQPKGRFNPPVPIHSSLWPFLQINLHSQYLFPAIGQSSKPFRTDFKRPWAKLIFQSGIRSEITPHSLRHTYGTLLAMSGCNAYQIQTLMRHSNPTISARYIHLAGSPVCRQAVESLPLLSSDIPIIQE